MAIYRFNATSEGRTGTIQSFIVPTDGTYIITAVGAAGSEGNMGTRVAPFPVGGNGAFVYGNFTLKAGDHLNIVVGQKGSHIPATTTLTDGATGGGGGYSAVFLDTPMGEFTKAGQPFTCLIMAAGGGGAGDYGYNVRYAIDGYPGDASNIYSPANYIAPTTTVNNTATASASFFGGSVQQYISYNSSGGQYTRGTSTSIGGFGAGGASDDNAPAGGGWYITTVSSYFNQAYSWCQGNNFSGITGYNSDHGWVDIIGGAPEWIDPIFDRTLADVEYARANPELISRSLKGRRESSDLNRIAENCAYINNILTEVANGIELSQRSGWTKTEFPNYNEIQAMVNDVSALRDITYVSPTLAATPTLPINTYQKMNLIERIIYEINYYIDNVIGEYVFSGEIYSGGRNP